MRGTNSKRPERGWLTTELVVAMGILTVTMLPLAFSFVSEMKLCRAYYYRAVAMEIVDGEMEILAAGEWRAFQPGTQTYAVRAEAAKVLPPSRFVLTLENSPREIANVASGDPEVFIPRGERVRLEWLPDKKNKGGRVVREARVK